MSRLSFEVQTLWLELTNTGIVITGQESATRNPILVIGPARSGTSMIAGTLHQLGLFMGDSATSPVYEDTKLAELIESGELGGALEVMNDYTSRGPKWGWKRPSSVDRLHDIHRLFGAPVYVFVYKDLLSIGVRNSISMKSDPFSSMEMALNQYKACLDFISEVNPYALHVSYEKAVRNPENLVAALIRFCQIDPSPDQIESAIEFIKPNPEEYLDATRVTKAVGWLDGAIDRTVYGWAYYAQSSIAPEVDILVNNRLIGTAKAELPREDLTEIFGRACAFFYTLPDEISLLPGDQIRARVSDEVRDLDNSPLRI
jgi:hypothetical protein